mmetsp:Transcript_25778/g.59595  ORF Transcript_25778/g.59595 Transcript_25778/m.59595 type:complete len:215 (+) Transcript_25778:88-732(+)
MFVSAATIGVLSAMEQEERYHHGHYGSHSGHGRSDFSSYTKYDTFAVPDYFSTSRGTSSWNSRSLSPGAYGTASCKSSSLSSGAGVRSWNSRGASPHASGQGSRRLSPEPGYHSHTSNGSNRSMRDNCRLEERTTRSGKTASPATATTDASTSGRRCTDIDDSSEEEEVHVGKNARASSPGRPKRNLAQKVKSILSDSGAAAMAAVSRHGRKGK